MSPAEAMVQQILARGAAAGRDKLAELAYQMARTCLSKAENKASATIRWFEDPRDVQDLHRDMARIEVRTRTDLDRSSLPLANPTTESAIGAARECNRVAAGIEPNSYRVRYIAARICKTDGDAEGAEAIFRSLLSTTLPRAWDACVRENLQAMDLAAGRFDAVVASGEALLRRSPERIDALFNMATAHAWLRSESAFDACCARFRRVLPTAVDHAYWITLVDREANWFAEQLGRDPEHIVTSFASPRSAREQP